MAFNFLFNGLKYPKKGFITDNPDWNTQDMQELSRSNNNMIGLNSNIGIIPQSSAHIGNNWSTNQSPFFQQQQQKLTPNKPESQDDPLKLLRNQSVNMGVSLLSNFSNGFGNSYQNAIKKYNNQLTPLDNLNQDQFQSKQDLFGSQYAKLGGNKGIFGMNSFSFDQGGEYQDKAKLYNFLAQEEPDDADFFNTQAYDNSQKFMQFQQQSSMNSMQETLEDMMKKVIGNQPPTSTIDEITPYVPQDWTKKNTTSQSTYQPTYAPELNVGFNVHGLDKYGSAYTGLDPKVTQATEEMLGKFPNLRLTSGKRSWGDKDGHPKGRAVDLSYDPKAYEYYKNTVVPKYGFNRALDPHHGTGTHIHLGYYKEGGSTNTPIYVTDTNDKRLRSYQDSLDLYRQGENLLKDIIPLNNTSYDSHKLHSILQNHPIATNYDKYTIKPSNIIGIDTKERGTSNPLFAVNSRRPMVANGDINALAGIPQYKKPVQPVELQSKQVPSIWTEKDIDPVFWKSFKRKYPNAIGIDPNKVDKNDEHIPIFANSLEPKKTSPSMQSLHPQNYNPMPEWEQRLYNGSKLRINNDDGSYSSHKMMNWESDGKFYAAPTIINNNGKLQELSPEDAIKYHQKNGTAKQFSTDEEAQVYANNGYKQLANVEKPESYYLPINPLILPQQHGKPVYGPGSTIIGYSNDDMKFNPAYQYTGAPNNQFNLQDKELLNNPDLLKQYIQNKDSGYHFKYGGIHINPANKGKFNALKARTGKTTEELTHSKNPLTRKRAIFAQNASHFHH